MRNTPQRMRSGILLNQPCCSTTRWTLVSIVLLIAASDSSSYLFVAAFDDNWDKGNSFLDSLERTCGKWPTRIIVTVSIMVAWEFFIQRPQRLANEVSRSNDATTEETTTTKTKTTSSKLNDKDTSNNNKSSRSHRSHLLDRLEQEQKQRKEEAVNNEEKTDEDSSSTGDNRKEKTKKEKKAVKNPSKAKKPKPANRSSASTPAASSAVTTTTSPPPIKATSNAHPGMGGFGHWYEVETSLFRIYTLGRHDDVEVVPPYVPHSYRGNVHIFMHVTNKTNITLNVFWVDYKGKHILKGSIKPSHVWTQTTWIDHPWVFEDAETQETYLYYVPYRVIPTLEDVNTVTSDGEGKHEFSIHPPLRNGPPYNISIKDDVMPFPADVHFHSPLLAITWTLQHMSRMMVIPEDPSLDILQKYLTNIVEHPEENKYRQLRIRSQKFAPIWNSSMRGLLLAVGFVEVGAYAELGCAQYPLNRERVQEVALLSYLVNQWREKEKGGKTLEQPEGADGFGRAGFGRAGNMN